MAKKLAIAVIHGIGSYATRPPDSATPSFSAELRERIRDEVNQPGDQAFDRDVAWREIFYSDITEANQDAFFNKVKAQLSFDTMREFVIKNLGDAAAYRLETGELEGQIYTQIHDRVAKTLRELRNDTAQAAPILVLAHSMGGHVLSNYIWDRQRNDPALPADVANANTIAAIVTFGCNIPIFTFGHRAQDIRAIEYPGTGLPQNLRRKGWWLNYYDKDDILGYPLGQAGAGYEALRQAGNLHDHRINAGNLFTSWNPLSHNGYWKDRDFYRPTAATIRWLLSRIA